MRKNDRHPLKPHVLKYTIFRYIMFGACGNVLPTTALLSVVPEGSHIAPIMRLLRNRVRHKRKSTKPLVAQAKPLFCVRNEHYFDQFHYYIPKVTTVISLFWIKE